jgi:phosphatidylglycerophosphate synthase
MNREHFFSIFSREEESANLKWRAFRDNFFKPVSGFLSGYGIQPSLLSYLGLAMVLPFIYFFPSNPWFSFLFILLNLFLDGIDGPYARYVHKDSLKGSITDLSCDYLSFLIIFMTFLYFGLMNYFWATLYILNYVLMLGFVIYCRNKKIRFFPVMRSKYYLYGTFFILIVWNINIFDPLLVFFSIYMVITNILLFDRIRCSSR